VSTPASASPESSTATFTITPVVSGHRRRAATITATEENPTAAFNVGLIKVMQEAGWHACLYGTVEIRHVESGRVWVVTVQETK